jgi:glutathione S-transferase
MLKIYGADLSAPANKVRFVANELGLEYDYIQISIRDGQNRTEEFLKLHPAGKVPVMDDDGFVLFESGAIIKYLAAKNNSSLFPDEPQKQALINQWMEFVAIHVNGAMGKVLFNRVFAPFAKVAVDERSLEDGVKFLGKFLPVVDNQLANNTYLAGNELSLADMTLLATLDPAEVGQMDLTSYAHINKWRSALKQKDFYTKCYKEYGEILKQTAKTRDSALFLEK